MLNDYSITNDGNATTNYLTIINLLKERNLIDLVGVQGHAFEFGGPNALVVITSEYDRYEV
jgi:endo-1,4-beta-xylanase